MTEMANPFITIGDNFMAESYNGAIAFFASCNAMITMTLPDDIGDNGTFILGTVDGDGNSVFTKAGFMLLNLALVNTEIYNNTIRLIGSNTVGTATFRVYPNIEPFKAWNLLSWVKTSTTGTVTCDIKRVSNGSVIHSNIANPEDLTNESMGLEYIDFVFTLTAVSGNNPILNTIQLILQGGL
jgi:hypothetical protein